MDHKLTITVPFETAEQATIALRSLDPDPEVKPHELEKRLEIRGSQLWAEFSASTDRSLRVGVNGFMASLGLVVECLSELPKSVPSS